MVNTCICCGESIPEGELICFACSYEGINCPDCGAPLTFMSSCSYYINAQTVYSKLYHCEKCHADWEAESSADKVDTNLKRKFWG